MDDARRHQHSVADDAASWSECLLSNALEVGKRLSVMIDGQRSLPPSRCLFRVDGHKSARINDKGNRAAIGDRELLGTGEAAPEKPLSGANPRALWLGPVPRPTFFADHRSD
jgi:hypothetical protein